MVEAVRRGQSQQQVARDFGVSPATVNRWVRHAHGQRLDRVDWSDRASIPHTTQRADATLEDLVLEVRSRLRSESDLGFFGAEAILAALQARGVEPLPAERTVYRILRRRGVLDGRVLPAAAARAGGSAAAEGGGSSHPVQAVPRVIRPAFLPRLIHVRHSMHMISMPVPDVVAVAVVRRFDHSGGCGTWPIKTGRPRDNRGRCSAVDIPAQQPTCPPRRTTPMMTRNARITVRDRRSRLTQRAGDVSRRGNLGGRVARRSGRAATGDG
jgi:transposase